MVNYNLQYVGDSQMRKCETNKMWEIIGFIPTRCSIFSYSHYSHIYYYYYFSVCMYVCVEAK
jgi:hypothetical protein